MDAASPAPLVRQIHHCRECLLTLASSTTIVACSGNHDEDEGGSPAHEKSWLSSMSARNLTVDGGTVQVGGWIIESVGWLGYPSVLGDSSIAVCHSPPDRCSTSITRAREEDHGDALLGDQLRAHRGPRMCLGGHVHSPCGWAEQIGSSWSFNPGRSDSRIPNHIILDLEAMTAQRNVYLKKSTRGGADRRISSRRLLCRSHFQRNRDSVG